MAGFTFSHTPVVVDHVDTKYRRIGTQIPVPESVPMLERAYALESRSMHGQMPVIWDRAENFQVFDAWGNCWIDFTSTIFVANAGHGNPRVVEAVKKVVEKPLLHTYTYMSSERLDYLEMLIEKTPAQFEKAFMLSAGTEATECALKLMRLNGQKKNERKSGIVCIEGNWHGRTLGAQMMGWNPQQKAWIGYQDPSIYHIPFPYPWREDAMEDPKAYFTKGLQTLLDEHNLDPDSDLCGFMLETFQGWGAVFYPPAFVQALAEFAKEHDMLVTFDEMQAGFGRTGELFGYMHYGVEPDLLCCGKGASSGLPLALVLGSAEVLDLPEIGSMSSTHSANPLVCAAGKANLEALFEDGIIENSKQLGAFFHQQLDAIAKRFSGQIGSIEGVGLLAALIFKDEAGNPLASLCDRIAELCMQRGLLVVHTGRESIKLAPPMSIHEDALLEGLAVLESSIADCVSEMEL
jgi:4-aminobutyrate aminotransferase-like enzyme